MNQKSSGMNRRNFFRTGMAGLGLAATKGVGAQETAPADADGPVQNIQYRVLGRTGLKVTVVSLGAFRTTEPAVIQAAFDRGVNFVDTARIYMGGRNEGYVAEALKGYQDKVYVCTKTEWKPKADMEQSIAESLEALKRKSVDVLMMHKVDSRDVVMNPEYRAVMAEVKKQGKTKFIGLSTHQREAEVLNAMVDDPEKLFDVVMVSYCFKSSPEVREAIARAAKAGIGVIAMKTQAGGYSTKAFGDIKPHQAALKWVLKDTNVTTTVPSMVDMDQVMEDTAVMGMPMTTADEEILHRYNDVLAGNYCHRCAQCEPDCPRGVGVAEVGRCLMYAEGYRDLPLAREEYARLDGVRNAAACGDCASCRAVCPNGLDIGNRMKRAHQILA